MRYLVILCGLLCALSACSTSSLISSAAKTGVVVAQERSVSDAVDDTAIFWEIKHLFLQKDVNDLLANVRIHVIEGEVYLTGDVYTRTARIDAVKLAWQPKGVRSVINEITIDETTNLKQAAKDKWMRTQIKTSLLTHKHIRSINYTVDVVDNTAYLMGIAQDATELERAAQVASRVGGIEQVVSYVRVKDGKGEIGG